MTDQSIEKDDGFLVPSLPLKKPASNPKENVANKISSLVAPVTDDYVPPSWAELPTESDHTIEVMNNGVIKDRHVLKNLASKKSYLTVGRMNTNDIEASILGASRLHCYLQYGDGFDGRGWYVYDKSSTQGTFLNKKEVPKNVYVKAKSGSIIQITKSNFHLFIEGTDLKQPPPTQITGLELKSPEPNFLDELKAKNERSFEKDPIGRLTQFCEREGIEFKVSRLASDDKEKKGFTYAFELPDDVTGGHGGSFTGQGPDVVSAQKACAFQVCKHLNELGLLNLDSQWGSRQNIENNDFYEEEEDTFFDRTGQIEAQRLKRIERHKANIGVKDKALTYPELLKKIADLNENREAVSEQLTRLIKPEDGAKVAPDEINLSSLNASLSVRLEISKLKRKYEQLTNELNLMERAACITKPLDFKMPVPKKPVVQETSPPEPLPSTISLSSEPSSSTNDSSQKAEPSNKASEPVKGPTLPTPKSKEPEQKSGGKTFGLLTRKDLQANKNAASNKRKIAEEFVEDDVDEKRNRTEKYEDPDNAAEWVAPVGQKGDGRTALNDKFGY